MARSFDIGYEINLHYKNSVILYRKDNKCSYRLAYITHVEKLTPKECRIHFKQSYKNFNGWTQSTYERYYDLKRPELKSNFNFSYPFRKCVNTKNSVALVYRKPHRQFTWGVSEANTVIIDSISNKKRRMHFSENVSVTPLYNIFFPEYYTVEDAFLKCVDSKYEAAAISPYVFLTPLKDTSPHLILIHYKRRVIGTLDDNLIAKLPQKMYFLESKLKPIFKNGINLV